MAEEPLARLQGLLRELFQYDYADLDFGIYRLLRLKRGEVEAFLTEQLPRRVDEVFKGATSEQRLVLENDFAGLTARVKKEIAEDALTATGEIKAEYRETKIKAARDLIEAYEATREAALGLHATDDHKAEVFNHLWAFFSRYYEAGDFIPKRRYGARETYAVPYNGEEVLFHWANRDQHYVKTAEALRDYAFTVDMLGKSCRARFTLTEASLPPSNTKGDTRYFFPLPKEAVWDKDARTFTLPFHYRLPTETEVENHGKNSKLQESVLQTTLPKIIAAVPDVGLKARLAEIVEQKESEEISLLLKQLRHFCRKNTSDYFIHKNLDGFLRRELEFYLKDQVLHLADLDGDLPAKQRTLRVVRQLAEEVIQFLAQIENVQKRLFEKRKFVLKTDYLVPIQNVPRDLWNEVIAQGKQLAAWKKLFAVAPRKVNEKFLAEHPTLVVNTAHFDSAFKARLLADFADLDEATEGLLIHSENYQALRFLARLYNGMFKCSYIDPPYNTGSDDFIYKDRYQHSTWAAMMWERLALAKRLLSIDAALLAQIGDEEQANLKKVLCDVFGERCFRNAVVVRRGIKNVQSQFEDIAALSVGHDTLFLFASHETTRLPKLFEELSEGEPGKWDTFWRGTDRRTMRYEIFGIKPEKGQWRWSEDRAYRAKKNYEEYQKKHAAKISLDDHYLQHLTAEGEELDFVRLNEEDGQKVVQYYVSPRNYKLMSDVWMDVRTRGDVAGFPTEKHVELIETSARWLAQKTGSVLDFFGGSGTTAHAVMNLNRLDGERRQFVLIEMARHFDTHLLPRIQKVMFTPALRDGMPVRAATQKEAERTPRLVKVLRLEGYEDALHNLVSDETLERETPRVKAFKQKVGGDAYRLTYMARLPLEASASMLNLAKLEHPFAYTIEVLGEDGPHTEMVDLLETFNFLYGLHVQRIESWRDEAGKRDYRAVKAKDKNGRRVLVLWRDMDKLDPAVERRFLETRLKKNGPFDEAWINGDCAVPGVQSLDGLFKRLLEEEER